MKISSVDALLNTPSSGDGDNEPISRASISSSAITKRRVRGNLIASSVRQDNPSLRSLLMAEKEK